MRGFELTRETIRDWEERFLPYFTEQTSTQVVVIIDGAGQDRTQTSRVPLMTTVAFHHQAAIAPCPSFIIFD